MLKMKKTRFILSAALISISVLALFGITYVSHIGNIVKKDEIRENAIDTMTVQDFSTRAASLRVAAGNGSYGAIHNGKLYVWGSNSYGQLGLGHTSYVDRPTWVSSLGSYVTDVSFGYNYGGAINNYGLYMWGQNQYGQLGTGNRSSYYSPTRVLSGSGISSISCSTARNPSGDGMHTAAIVNGYIFTWGTGANSRLGHHNDDKDRLSPSSTEYIRQDGWGDDNEGATALTVSVGARHTVGTARLPNGYRGIFSFGDSDRNSSIAFTVSPWLSRDFPTTWDDEVVDGRTFYGSGVSVDAHNDHNVAVISNTLWTWGDNDDYQLGSGAAWSQEYAKPRSFLSSVYAVAAGYNFNAAISGSGYLYYWGNGNASIRSAPGSNWSQIATTTYSGTNIGVHNSEVWMWDIYGNGYKYNINDSITIDLNATNDPNGYRSSVVYNLDADELRKLIVSSSSRMSLPISYNVDSRTNLGATPLSSTMVGQVSARAASSYDYWFFTTYVTFRGFLPVKDTVNIDTGNMILTAVDNEPMFANMGVNQIFDEAKKNDESSLLAQWIYNKSGYTNIFNPSDLYSIYFPKNTKITGIDSFERVRSSSDQTKWEIRFKITVDKYYKYSGSNLIEWNTGPDLALNQYVTITNLPQVMYEEDSVDENKNLVILNTRINHDGKDITDAETFFTTLTGDIGGGEVLDISLSELTLIRRYIDIRFIPDWYYESDLKTKQPNHIYITRNYTDEADTEDVKHINFTIAADKYFTNYGDLKSNYSNTVKFKIERNTSDIQQIENTQELTKQYTTGDFIDLLAPNNAATGATVPNNNINTKIAKDYLKFINFPGDTIYDLITTDAQNENEQGRLTFKVSANQYYIDSKFELQKESKTFDTFTLDGFKPSYDISVYPVEIQQDKITQIQSSANFYDEITKGSGTKVDIDQISQYFTMHAIPDDANISLIRLDNNDSSVIKFQMTSDRYTDNGGRTIKASITREFEIKVASVDTTLIIILATSGIFLVFLIWALIVTIKNKRSVEIQHGNATI